MEDTVFAAFLVIKDELYGDVGLSGPFRVRRDRAMAIGIARISGWGGVFGHNDKREPNSPMNVQLILTTGAMIRTAEVKIDKHCSPWWCTWCHGMPKPWPFQFDRRVHAQV